MTAIRPVRAGWRGAVLVCGRCSRRIGGGFGAKGGKSLVGRLRKALDLKGRKARAGVAEVKCLGLCPKRGVVVVDSARPGRWLVVAPGTPVDEVVAMLPSLAAPVLAPVLAPALAEVPLQA